MSLKRATLAISTLLLSAAISAFGQSVPASESKASSATPGGAYGNGYRIGAEDALTVNVWHEPELSASLVVRPDGMISLPLLRDVKAAGRTPIELADAIQTALTNYVNEPHVTVVVTQANSQKIYVIGQVMRPGAYPLLPGMSLLQSISAAGGLAQFSDGKKSYVLQAASKDRVSFNYKELIRGRGTGLEIQLHAGDTVVVR